MYFRSEAANLTRERLRIEIDEYGVPALVVANLRGQEWQANLRLPPGLAAGTHQVRLRTADGGYGNWFHDYCGAGGRAAGRAPRHAARTGRADEARRGCARSATA